MKSRLLLYDTSNFVNLPIGGQLTSISNFLKYLSETHKEILENMILIGVSEYQDKIGKMGKVCIHGIEVDFFPVALVETDLSHTQKSLRLAYVKGLLRYGRKLGIRGKDCNYIHTPEAFAAIKFLNPFAKCAVFSHGSFFNMEKGFRFFQKNTLIKKGFMAYICYLLRKAKILFVLDEDSEKAYLPFNKKVVRVYNSIVPNKKVWEEKDFRGNLVFVGRLSREKRVTTIIQAVQGMEEEYNLTIIGDGEEYENLIPYANNRIHFTGAILPSEVKKRLEEVDILIMNSTLEGIPMTILEALSYGIPVVTTDVGGIGTVLRYGIDSEKTDGTDLSIKNAVIKMAKDYKSYSKAAFEQSKEFDYRNINKHILQELAKEWPGIVV